MVRHFPSLLIAFPIIGGLMQWLETSFSPKLLTGTVCSLLPHVQFPPRFRRLTGQFSSLRDGTAIGFTRAISLFGKRRANYAMRQKTFLIIYKVFCFCCICRVSPFLVEQHRAGIYVKKSMRIKFHTAGLLLISKSP